MTTRNYTKYEKPYPTISDLIKDGDYDYIFLYSQEREDTGRVYWVEGGWFPIEKGEIDPSYADQCDIYREVAESVEYYSPEEGVDHCLLIFLRLE